MMSDARKVTSVYDSQNLLLQTNKMKVNARSETINYLIGNHHFNEHCSFVIQTFDNY